MSLVSAVIPVYNDAKHLAHAIESVLEQTFKDIEVVVVDDGSSDGSPDVAKSYGDKIRYIRQENAGVATARNTGYRASQGKYLCFLDSDDAFKPKKVELQLSLLEQNPKAGLCYGIYQQIDPRDGSVVGQHNVDHSKFDRSDDPFPPDFQIGAALIRREWMDKVGGFDVRFRRAEDSDLRYRLWAAGCGFLPIEEVVCDWTLGVGNMSDTTMWSEHLQYIERHFESMGEEINEATRNRLRADTLLKLGTNHLRAGHRDEARAAWLKALACQPDIFGRLDNWGVISRFLDPSFPLRDARSFPDVRPAWDLARQAVAEAMNQKDEAPGEVGVVRPGKSASRFALARLASFKGNTWRARRWLLAALLAGKGRLPKETVRTEAIQILLGPLLTRTVLKAVGSKREAAKPVAG